MIWVDDLQTLRPTQWVRLWLINSPWLPDQDFGLHQVGDIRAILAAQDDAPADEFAVEVIP